MAHWRPAGDHIRNGTRQLVQDHLDLQQAKRCIHRCPKNVRPRKSWGSGDITGDMALTFRLVDVLRHFWILWEHCSCMYKLCYRCMCSPVLASPNLEGTDAWPGRQCTWIVHDGRVFIRSWCWDPNFRDRHLRKITENCCLPAEKPKSAVDT